jgi:hypothetical protein
MFRTILIVALTAVIALGGGAYSAWYAVNHFDGFGAVRAGGWTAYPQQGTGDADPYSRARTAREGALPLGAAEGIAFYAYADDSGAPLLRDCEYRIAGDSPPARFWTLHAADAALAPLTLPAGLPDALHSEEIIRRQDGNYTIDISPEARPGNWLAIGGVGPMVLVMTLYDTPATGDSGLIGLKFPTISKVACHA